MAAYRFVDTWFVPTDPGTVYALLSCPREYPRWWGEAFLEGEGDAGPAVPGKQARLLTRGRLPYTLRWTLTCVEAVEPSRLVSRITGDFEGEGIWTIAPVEGGTRVVLEWNVDVRKPLVRRLTPMLRPLFRWNHRWAMRHGERNIRELTAPLVAAIRAA
ncbi:MAG: SRPBCC family protein [Gaiella sp.]